MQNETQRKKTQMIKIKQIISECSNNIKWFKISVVGVPKGKKK